MTASEIFVPQAGARSPASRTRPGSGEGVDVAGLEAITRLSVRTRNTLYRLTVVDPEEWQVLVLGGRFFPTERVAYLCGSGYGGTLAEGRLGRRRHVLRVLARWTARRDLTRPGVRGASPMRSPGPVLSRRDRRRQRPHGCGWRRPRTLTTSTTSSGPAPSSSLDYGGSYDRYLEPTGFGTHSVTTLVGELDR